MDTTSMTTCPQCNEEVTSSHIVGVRTLTEGGLWTISDTCEHILSKGTVGNAAASSGLAVYNGGPLWQNGYTWVNVYWGSWFTNNPTWVANVDTASLNIENSTAYSGGLTQYNVGQGKFLPHIIITTDPASPLTEAAIVSQINKWVADGTLPNLGTTGAYNIFLPPGVTATLGVDASCIVFCDYHDSGNGNAGPFFTVEPYPCNNGCNQCTSSDFDTLTQGLSEEMIELKTDMNPGTGWVIGNGEICDYCDQSFVCNKIETGEYVNSWYDNATSACWISTGTPPPPPPPPSNILIRIIEAIIKFLKSIFG